MILILTPNQVKVLTVTYNILGLVGPSKFLLSRENFMLSSRMKSAIIISKYEILTSHLSLLRRNVVCKQICVPTSFVNSALGPKWFKRPLISWAGSITNVKHYLISTNVGLKSFLMYWLIDRQGSQLNCRKVECSTFTEMGWKQFLPRVDITPG